MVINGHVRQACSALVDRLLEDNPDEIELRPMQKFPVVRDLVVDRGRLFQALEKLDCWIPVDGYYDLGPGPQVSQAVAARALSAERVHELRLLLGGLPAIHEDRAAAPRRRDRRSNSPPAANAAYDRGFVGAHAISQVMLFNSHPVGKMNAAERIDALTDEGGIQVCGNAQNCVQVCPKHIPLTRSIGRAGRAATVRAIRRIFDR